MVLEAAGSLDCNMARNLLEEAGIPCLVHGPDFDVAELGVVSHQNVRGASVYVPKSAYERAMRVLAEAWGERPG